MREVFRRCRAFGSHVSQIDPPQHEQITSPSMHSSHWRFVQFSHWTYGATWLSSETVCPQVIGSGVVLIFLISFLSFFLFGQLQANIQKHGALFVVYGGRDDGYITALHRLLFDEILSAQLRHPFVGS